MIDDALEKFVLPIDLLATKSCLRRHRFRLRIPDYDHVRAAMDGDMGNMVPGVAGEIGLYCLDKSYDHDFRQITTRTRPITSLGDCMASR